VLPQLSAPVSAVTVPEPDFVTSSGYDVTPVNCAVTKRDWSMVTVQVSELPLQPPPDQPTNESPPNACAVSVTLVEAP
jgi:hypothetical protein